MNEIQSFPTWFFICILLLTVSIGFICGFLWGRYVLWSKGEGKIITQINTVKPERTLRVRDFKPKQIYAAMASTLTREKKLTVTSVTDPMKVKKALEKQFANAKEKPIIFYHAVEGQNNTYVFTI